MSWAWPPPLLQAAEPGAPDSYGLQLVEALLALVAVCLLAWAALRLLSRYGMGRSSSGRALRVLERLPLDARRSVCLVEAGSRVFLVGLGDGAAPRLLAELDPASVPREVARRAGGDRGGGEHGSQRPDVG